MTSDRFNIISQNKRQSLFINNTQEIMLGIRQLIRKHNLFEKKILNQICQIKIGGNVNKSIIQSGNKNTINYNVYFSIDLMKYIGDIELSKLKQIVIDSEPLSEILNMLYEDIKEYKNTDNINYIKRACNKWLSSICFLHSISENELKKPPFTENIDKLISKMSHKYYRDITEYLTKTCSGIKNNGINQALFQIRECVHNNNILYYISISIIIQMEIRLSEAK